MFFVKECLVSVIENRFRVLRTKKNGTKLVLVFFIIIEGIGIA